MAASSILLSSTVLCSSNSSVPKLNFKPPLKFAGSVGGPRVRIRSPTRLNGAKFAEIEPDLNEDPTDRWETNSISPEWMISIMEFMMDITHIMKVVLKERLSNHWRKNTIPWSLLLDFNGLISWIFPPAVAAGLYFHAPGEYLFIGAALFTVIFCIIEMDKPDQPHNFEPQIYNMERGARDKLISEYNTMDIWDFNEKYGDLWDFTVKKDDIMRR